MNLFIGCWSHQKESFLIKNWKDVVPNISPFNSPIWPLQKVYRSWRKTAGDGKQVAHIEASVPDVVFLLEEINTSLDTRHTAIDLASAFFLSMGP